MAIKTDNQLKTQFEVIRDETAEGGNTKERVYNALLDSFETLNDRIPAPPVTPSGFAWVTAPYAEILDDVVYVTSSVSIVNGVQKTAAADDFTPQLPPDGYIEPCIVVLNYNATPQVYEIVFGETYAENDSYIFPPVPANRALVGNFLLRNTGITQTPSGAIKTIRLNGADYVADTNGKADLGVIGGGGGNVDTVNGQTPDGSKNVLIEAQHIDYTPADSNNITGFFAGLLTSGILSVKAALDAIVTALKDKTPYQLPTISYATTVVIDCLNKIQPTAAPITLTGNMDLSVSNLPATAVFSIDVVAQSATRTVTLPVGYRMANGSSRTLSLDAGKTATIVIKYNGTEYLAGFIK